MDLLICFMAGIGIGLAITTLTYFLLILMRPDGIFLIDQSDPLVDRYHLEMKTDLNKLPKQFWIVLRVEKK